MAQEKVVFIPLETAQELVAPEELEDVLSFMADAGLIASFTILTDHVRIRPLEDKNFELAFVHTDDTNPTLSASARKKLN